MSIDLFWTGFAAGVLGLFVMQLFINKVIYPRLKGKTRR
jgi:hypothetical protein